MKNIKECLSLEYRGNVGDTRLPHVLLIFLSRDSSWLRWRFIKHMRIANSRKKKDVVWFWHQFHKNILGNRLGYEINGKNIGEGLILYHNGPIVINGDAIIGKNCKLHGDNCIGNNGISNGCPHIGDNVNIGVGAKIIGDVVIADGCFIGAGAVVVSNCFEENSTIVGVPGKKIIGEVV